MSTQPVPAKEAAFTSSAPADDFPPSSDTSDASPDPSAEGKPHWFRSVLTQATIVGLLAFAAPGLWNALQSVGAGGQQTPFLVMAGNALLFSLMTVTCLSSSLIINRIGLRWTLVIGTTGYALYSAALYQNNRYGTVWFIYVGSAACGITAGLFWAAEGAVMLSYPEPEKRGRYLAYWLAYRNSGAILGGAINLAFNATGTRLGSLDWRTYIVFVTLREFFGGWEVFLVLIRLIVDRMSWTRDRVAAQPAVEGATVEWDESQGARAPAVQGRVYRDSEADGAPGVPIAVRFLPFRHHFSHFRCLLVVWENQTADLCFFSSLASPTSAT